MTFWRTRLHYRLMVSFVFILLLPILLLTLYFSVQLSAVLRAQALSSNQQIARDRVRDVEVAVLRANASLLTPSPILAQIDELLLKDLPPFMRLYVVDEDGNFLRHPNAPLSSPALAELPRLTALMPRSGALMLAQPRGALYGPSDGRESLWVYERIEVVETAPTWTVIYELPLAIVEQPIVESRWVVVGLTSGLLALTLVFSGWAARRIALPIRQLSQAAQRIEAGDWQAPIPTLRNRDEIGALGRAMGRMAATMQSLIRDLHERVRDLEETRALLMRRADELEALRQIALASSSTLDQDEMLERLLDALATLVPYTSASVTLYDGQSVRFVAMRGLPDQVDWGKLEAALETSAKLRDRAYNRQILLVEDVRQQDFWQPFDPQLDYIRSWMGVPLLHRGRLIGYLNLDHEQVGFYTIEHAALANAVGQQMALALENTRLFNQMEHAVKERTAELRAEQERLLAIVENVEDAIMFTNERGGLLYVNPSWRVLNGYSLDEALKLSAWALHERWTAPHPELMQALHQGNPWHGELKLRRRDGAVYDSHISIVPVYDTDSSLHYFVSVERDITKAKELEALKARFVADAAHDLRNPISVLMTNLYILNRAPAQLPQRLPILEYQVSRLEALINDLLTVARLDRDHELSEASPFDLGFLVAHVCESQATLAHDKSLHFTHWLSSHSLLILGDVQQMERVVVNLIANALAYTPQGGRVEVRVDVIEGEIVLEVVDTGIGIASDEQEHIFERFYRASNARKTDGTGLGLAIVKEIVARHKGRIELHSVLGQGTSFRVYFSPCDPLLPAQAQGEAQGG
jgi:PAS domain S-box-containing protein